jgi:hypothetical protein
MFITVSLIQCRNRLTQPLGHLVHTFSRCDPITLVIFIIFSFPRSCVGMHTNGRTPVQVLLLPGSVNHKAVLLAAVQDDFLLPALEDFDLDPDIAETVMQQHFIQ